MKNLFKKNQLMITALAIMIAIAGYLQFAGGTPKNAVETGSGQVTENNPEKDLFDLSAEDLSWADNTEIQSMDSESEKIYVNDYLDTDMAQTQTDLAKTEGTPDEGEIPGEAVFTANTGVSVLADAKLLKEQTRARNKEMLLDIINSETLSEAQKQVAVDSMVHMTEISEKESAAEILLEAKGYEDVVVSINGTNADVVVNAVALDDVARAQIEDIVKRKTGVAAENIIISTVVQ